MNQGTWISLESADEAAALLTFGCQPLPGQPFSRQTHVDGGDRVIFFFEYAPETVRLRKRWRGDISATPEDVPMDDIKRAFGYYPELLEVTRGNKSLQTKRRRRTLATFAVRDVKLA